MARVTVAIVWCLTAPSLASAQPMADTNPLKAPNGWRGETIRLPPAFAPDMKLNGTEYLRFAPGMFQPGSESFLSYVLVFQLPGEPPTHEAAKRELLTYYRGLSSAVLKSRSVEVDPAEFKLDLTEVSETAGRTGRPAGIGQWAGDLQWVEPFVTGRQQTLRLQLQVWKHGSSSYLSVCASPAEKNAAIWRQMREIQANFKRSHGS